MSVFAFSPSPATPPLSPLDPLEDLGLSPTKQWRSQAPDSWINPCQQDRTMLSCNIIRSVALVQVHSDMVRR